MHVFNSLDSYATDEVTEQYGVLYVIFFFFFCIYAMTMRGAVLLMHTYAYTALEGNSNICFIIEHICLESTCE